MSAVDGNRIFNFFFAQTIRQFFNIDHSIIKKRLQSIFFPLRFKDIKEIDSEDEHLELGTPELYIPLMSLITFVIITLMIKVI